MEEDLEPVYYCCLNCGSENASYLEQYANGEHWVCNDCGYERFYNNPDKNLD